MHSGHLGTLATCSEEGLSSLAGKCPGGSNLFDLSLAGFDGFIYAPNFASSSYAGVEGVVYLAGSV